MNNANRLHYIDLRPAPLATQERHPIARAIGATTLAIGCLVLMLDYFDILTK